VSKVDNLDHHTDRTLHDVRDKRIKNRKQWLKKSRPTLWENSRSILSRRTK
jgi:hypothetical protein